MSNGDGDSGLTGNSPTSTTAFSSFTSGRLAGGGGDGLYSRLLQGGRLAAAEDPRYGNPAGVSFHSGERILKFLGRMFFREVLRGNFGLNFLLKHSLFLNFD